MVQTQPSNVFSKKALNRLLLCISCSLLGAQPSIASSTLVTDAVGTEELWTFQEILGAQKLVSRINQNVCCHSG